jgi:serine/threonine protein kinase
MANLAGQQLGNYRLIRLLGKGGFGEVYLAEHLLLERQQAIKVLLDQHFEDARFKERFLREARTLAKLDHPNIVHVDELGVQGNVIYLVMPYISRGTLQQVLRRQAGPLTLTRVEDYLEQICAALDFAHARGVVHLDLKPLNLLLHADGRLLLSDFGLAHLMKEGAVQGGTSLSFGTPLYMAPEHLRGRPDHRSDLYALGVMLFQMLTGYPPFDGPTPEAIIVGHLTEPPPSLRSVNPSLPPALDLVLSKALAKRPGERYQTASELLADFKRALGHQESRTLEGRSSQWDTGRAFRTTLPAKVPEPLETTQPPTVGKWEPIPTRPLPYPSLKTTVPPTSPGTQGRSRPRRKLVASLVLVMIALIVLGALAVGYRRFFESSKTLSGRLYFTSPSPTATTASFVFPSPAGTTPSGITQATPGDPEATKFIINVTTAKSYTSTYDPINVTSTFKIGETVNVLWRVRRAKANDVISVKWYQNGSPITNIDVKNTQETIAKDGDWNGVFGLAYPSASVGTAEVYYNGTLAWTILFTITN